MQTNSPISDFTYKTVPNIQFVNGGAASLATFAAELGIKRPFIVTDEGVTNLGLLDSGLASLASDKTSYEVFSGVVADPPEAIIVEAAELSIKTRCDGVIGFGGGSSMDAAKLVAVLMRQEQSLNEIYGVGKIVSARTPLMQIPTTAGTGSEATSVAIVTTREFTKAGVVSDVLYADTILLDPGLTLGLPPHVTAATGIDAMVHAIEAFTSKRLKNPISDMLAVKALSLLSSSIRQAVKHGNDLTARSDMLLGAMFAGQAFANAPVGAVHALAYPLGGVFHIPHGLSNSLVLPHVLRFNEAAADSLYAELMPYIINTSLTKNYDDSNIQSNASERLATYFFNLARDLGLPTSLSQVDIPESSLEKLAEQSMLQERLLINNPRTMSYTQALEIYRQTF